MNSEPVNMPLLGRLVPDGIKPGTIFVVEFDPESHWFAVAVTITAACVKNGSMRDTWPWHVHVRRSLPTSQT